MIKRTIEISKEAAHLSSERKQLLIRQSGEIAGSIPCEDIGMVVVDHPGTTYSHSALNALLQNGATVLVCGADHLPAGVLLPISDHSEVVWRIKDQISISKPRQKSLWQQIVQAKIRNQAIVVSDQNAAFSKLSALAKTVKSGDPANVEAYAAKIYWRNFLSDDERFSRDKNGSGVNGFLNYGYSIVRTAISRAIVAAGMLPALGLHHHNRSNAFCLADDLIEPFRPLVDFVARDLYRQGHDSLTVEAKKELLEILTMTVQVDDQLGPLMVFLHRMLASLAECYSGGSRTLLIPDISSLISQTGNS